MVHPVAVNILEEVNTLNLTHCFLWNEGFVFFIKLLTVFYKLVSEVIFLERFKFFIAKFEEFFFFIFIEEPTSEMLSKTIKIPMFFIFT